MLQTNRYWEVPSHWTGSIRQSLGDKPEFWGVSLLWYCAFCGEVYAKASIPDRPYRACSGCCMHCAGNRWSIPGSLETVSLVGAELPDRVWFYTLDCELAFLSNPQHPHNREVQ